MFPHITHIDDLLPFIKDNPLIRVQVDEKTGHTVVCYMLQDEDTFAGQHEHQERECRGITFHWNGRVAARTLHKFFNIGQRADVMPENFHWQDVTRIMVKRDGSMVTPVLRSLPNVPMEHINQFSFKTKKTFSSPEAENAELIARSTPGGFEWILKVLKQDLTPTFEMTSPKFPIVLTYQKDELTLLHVRDNGTGQYLSEKELLELNSPFPLVENVMDKFIGQGLPQNLVSWQKLKDFAETAEGVEGVVIQFGQEMVKLKTIWYCNLHNSVTFTRWRDVARSVVADQADDLKAAFVMTGRSPQPIIDVEKKIMTTISWAKAAVDEIVAAGKDQGLSQKDMALTHKGHVMFGQIMRIFGDRPVDWMDWYAKNHLDTDWSLEVIPAM